MFKYRRRRNDDETLIGVDSTVLDVDGGSAAIDSTASVYVRPNHNSVTRVYLNSSSALIVSGDSANVVFPTGIFYKRITNANPFPVQLDFAVGAQSFRVCIEADSVCHDMTVVPAPDIDEPRGQRWCERVGVITQELLDKGVVETREDGSLVVWKTFRHSPSKLTPFGIWCNDPGNCQYTVLTADEYRQLCLSCLSFPVEEVRVSAIPLFSKNIAGSDALFVDLDARFPFLLQAGAVVADSSV